ncbi:CRISPR-associated endonuclease Cas2 [Candidatus Kaiserbacteria bacterium]|nr:CRISPR-associated endonuclease Cas2 [Candidatus Kaiserbacteria bacterium]
MATKFKGIKTAAEYRRGELTRDILKLVAAGVVVGGMAVAAPNTLQLIDYLNPKGVRERKRIWSTIRYLEQKNRIRIEERGHDQYVYLTSAGETKLNEDTIWELAIKAPYRWDRKWRIVMFDLPSKHEQARKSFRLKLEDLGFKLYQRSVFIYPHECHQEVLTIAKWYGVDEYIRYIVATEIHDMRRFVQEFDLL